MLCLAKVRYSMVQYGMIQYSMQQYCMVLCAMLTRTTLRKICYLFIFSLPLLRFDPGMAGHCVDRILSCCRN